MTGSNEIWREGSKITVDHDRNRIHILSVGDFDVAHARRCQEFIFEIFNKSDSYFDLVIDISREGKNGPGTRKVWKEINAHPKVRHVAICGVNSFVKIVHTFIIGFKKHPRLRLFTNKEEAALWFEGMIENFKQWFNTGKGEVPLNNQEVLIDVQGANYIGRFDASKAVFRVEGEIQETVFKIQSHHILWKPYKQLVGKTEQFVISKE